jgi:hypothetical protein
MADTKVLGGLRMLVKILLMWNANMMIDGGDESILATSLLKVSDLIVLKINNVSLLISNS